MSNLRTWSEKSSFRYSGSVEEGTIITFGSGHSVTVNASDYSKLLNHFKGQTVPIGTSRDKPSSGSIGEWLKENVTKTAIASYVGPILISEGYATKEGKSQIRIRKTVICRELIGNKQLTNKVDFNRYHYLHPDGRQLIQGWLARASEMENSNPKKHFEPFIFAWIALNGWAACVTGLDRDREWIDALILDEKINEKFDQLVINEQSTIKRFGVEFQKYWPIFKAQNIRRAGISYKDYRDRNEVVNFYLENNIRYFEPQCWKKHKENNNEAPLDWPHTLSALYRVRCNLFHGEKARHSEMDQSIVSNAFLLLVNFEKELFNMR